MSLSYNKLFFRTQRINGSTFPLYKSLRIIRRQSKIHYFDNNILFNIIIGTGNQASYWVLSFNLRSRQIRWT